ncbi:phytanoyl-CoA dioxygenase family protein [Sorangium sp. So ce1099]|uniref:phytanoyl-CoA dioxygenase family protein n=1 Tax=Sorangium sp. So ce1099 TaxID=3133331 RepID=UPI003F62D28B
MSTTTTTRTTTPRAPVGREAAAPAAAPPARIAEQLRRDGYVLVRDVLSPERFAAVEAAAHRCLPAPANLEPAEPGAKGMRTVFFPFAETDLNLLVVEHVFLDLARAVLGSDDLRVGDPVLQGKYGTRFGSTRNQRLHHDAFEGASLVAARPRGEHQRMFVIYYFTDVADETLAPTCVVPRGDCQDVPLLTEDGLASYDPERYPALYEAERAVLAPANSALVTLGDTIHRGSAMTAESAYRFALFVNYHTGRATWQRQPNWVGLPGDPRSESARRFMAAASPRQRSALGVPPPGDPYWDEQTRALMARMYPGLDLRPYEA